MPRLRFLDWMRGLAVLLMIQCHAFNSLVRDDLRAGGPYVLSQFVGGMAAPLFLFMAGATLGFQMENWERHGLHPPRRWVLALRRGAYVLGIAFLFRFTNWVGSLPRADLHELGKVDVLNCMGVAMLGLSVAAVFESSARARFAAIAAAAIAGATPLMSHLPWSRASWLLHQYVAPGFGAGFFPFFPFASYIGFGFAAGTVIRRTSAERLDRLMQWSVLAGFALVFGGKYFADIPYSIYADSNFWVDSPTLIFIRTGISLLFLSASYVWTVYCARPGWSWMECLGKNSLMVYWVHIMLVYGNLAKPHQRRLTIPRTVFATVLVTALMTGLSAAWLWWKARRQAYGLRPATEKQARAV